MKERYIVFGTTVLALAFFLGGLFSAGHNSAMHSGDSMDGEMLASGDYSCCLEEQCTYCMADSDHEEGCDCLEHVKEGKHPCGECIGEILEGHGNSQLSKYFASAIAEEVGEQHLETLKQIMEEKYGVPVEEQV